MVGITLSPEQIRSAPTEVRQWLEHEIAISLGIRPNSKTLVGRERLTACTVQEAVALYASIRGMLPVVNVLFELGREGASIDEQGVEAFRFVDMLRHTRLSSAQQLGACLQLIDQSFREIRHDNDAALLILDPRGHCLVAAETQRSILAVWKQVAAEQQIDQSDIGSAVDGAAALAVPLTMSGAAPASSAHLQRPFAVAEEPAAATFPEEKT